MAPKGIVVVQQGFVGLAMRRGDPMILEPGMHQWSDENIAWKGFLNLDSSAISMGPYTLVLVETSYAAITSDNGKQVVLKGGSAYVLTHKNWKFQAWLSLKVQTDQIGPFLTTSGDNINLLLTCTINWKVEDERLAASKNVDLGTGSRDSLNMIRSDVHLQVRSVLAALVGSVAFAKTKDSQTETHRGISADVLGAKRDKSALTDMSIIAEYMADVNKVCSRYGVRVSAINVQNPSPMDPRLKEILALGANASTEADALVKKAQADANAKLIDAGTRAQQARAAAEARIITANADAKAVTISVQGEEARAKAGAEALIVKAQSEAEAIKVNAKAKANAERIRAEGQRQAGLIMGESEFAVGLEKLKITYAPFAKNKSNNFFFGVQGGGDVPGALLQKNQAGALALGGALHVR